tara:strand:+ start:254 stop:523 length:270 start_codon:yes stop_codon:yes gene_type:complete
MKYDELNSIKKINNIFLVDDLTIWDKLSSYQDGYPSNIVILNDSVIQIQDINYFIQDVSNIVNDFQCGFNDFNENEIKYLTKIVKQLDK